MAGSAPKTILSELGDDIVEFSVAQKQAGHLNEVGWKKLFNRIKLLGERSEFLAPSLLMQANMHEVKGDAAQAKVVIDKYFGIYGETQDWYIVRANMGRIFGNPLLISEMLTSAFPHGNLTRLQSILEVCEGSGFYRSAYEILLKIEEINPSRARQLVKAMPGILPAARYINEHNLDEVRISERILMLTKLVNDSGYMLRSSRVLTNEFGIIYEVVIDDDIEKLALLNLTTYDTLASQFDFAYSEHISVGTAPMENHHDSK